MKESKIRQEPQDVTVLTGQVKSMTPVQIAQTIALLNMAAAVFAGFATIEAASKKSRPRDTKGVNHDINKHSGH